MRRTDRDFRDRLLTLKGSIREISRTHDGWMPQSPPLHTRHGTDGRVLEQHAPTPSTTVVRIRAAVRRATP